MDQFDTFWEKLIFLLFRLLPFGLFVLWWKHTEIIHLKLGNTLCDIGTALLICWMGLYVIQWLAYNTAGDDSNW